MSSLNYHIKTIHDEINKKTYPCEICGDVSSSRKSLTIHKKVHVELRRNYACSQCDKVYSTASSLSAHRKWHRGEAFKCIHCPKMFVIKNEYKIHLRFHTMDYPYQCETCGKKFNVKSHLDHHVKMHLGWRLKCKECGKLFSCRKSYTEHMFKHTGMPMPFTCLHCPKAYPSKSKLRFHLKTTHLMDIPMEELGKLYAKKPTLRVKEELDWVKVVPIKEEDDILQQR